MIDEYVNKVIQGDCLEVMKKLPDKYVDLVVTSPPYNMGKVSLGYQPNSTVGQSFYGENCDDNKNDSEYIKWCIEIINKCLRISNYVFWNVQFVRSTRNMVFELQSVFKNKIKDIFIWEKQAVASITSKKGGMAKGWEYIFMLGQDNLSTFTNNSFPENGYVPNIKTWYKKESFKEHHATFPIAMPSYFIKNFTKKDNIVLDPFLGTGTTALACVKLNRRFIGIEKEERYCRIAQDRIDAELNQLKLF